MQSRPQSPRYPCPAKRETDEGKGNEGSENEIDRVTVCKDEGRVSYQAEKLRANNLIGLEHLPVVQKFKTQSSGHRYGNNRTLLSYSLFI